MLLAWKRWFSSRANSTTPGAFHYELNARILACKTPQDLDKLVMKSADLLQRFNQVNVSTAVKALARMRSGSNATSQALLTRAVEMNLCPRHLSNISHGIARGRLASAIPNGILNQVKQKLVGFEPQGLSNVLWSLATLQQRNDAALLESLCRELQSSQARMNSQDMANSAWAVATLGFPHLGLFTNLQRELSQREEARLDDFTPQQLCNLVWAFATMSPALGHMDFAPSCGVLSRVIANKITKFQPKDLSIALWSFAQLKSNLLCDLVEQQVLERNLSTFPSQALSNIVLGMVKLKPPASCLRVVERIMGEICARGESGSLQGFTPQDICNLCWGLASVHLEDCHVQHTGAFVRLVVERSRAMLKEFSPQDLSQLSWSLAKLGKKQDHLEALFTLIAEQVAAASAQELRRFDPQDVSNLVWAFATAHNGARKECVARKEMFDRLAIDFLCRKSSFPPQALAILAWSFATLKQDDILLFQGIASEMVARQSCSSLQSLCSKDVAMLLWGFAAIEFKDVGMLQVLGNWVSKNAIHEKDLIFLSNVLWSFAVLDHRDQGLVDAISSKLGGDSIPMEALWSLACLDVLELDSVKQVFASVDFAKYDYTKRDAVQLLFVQLAWNQVHKTGMVLALKPGRSASIGEPAMHLSTDFHCSSNSHLRLSKLLQQVLLEGGHSARVVNEAVLVGGIVVDIYVPELNLVVEVDGPFHFMVNAPKERTGKTLFKHRLLTRSGFKVLSILAKDAMLMSSDDLRDLLRRTVNVS